MMAQVELQHRLPPLYGETPAGYVNTSIILCIRAGASRYAYCIENRSPSGVPGSPSHESASGVVTQIIRPAGAVLRCAPPLPVPQIAGLRPCSRNGGTIVDPANGRDKRYCVPANAPSGQNQGEYFHAAQYRGNGLSTVCYMRRGMAAHPLLQMINIGTREARRLRQLPLRHTSLLPVLREKLCKL